MISQEQREIMYKGLAMKGRLVYDAAEDAAIEAGLQRDPSDYFLWCAKGILTKNLEESVRYFSVALSLRPLAAHTRYNRGRRYMSQGRYVEALSDLALATTLDADDGWKWHFYGVALYFTDQLTKAAEAFAKAIEVNERNGLDLLPFDAEWQWNCWCKAGEPEKAAACIAAVDETTPVVASEATYKRRVLLYRGLISPEVFRAGIDEADALEAANQMYGLANYYFYLCHDTKKSMECLNRVLANEKACLGWGYKMAKRDEPIRRALL